MNIEADIRNLSKWLNEEQAAPIDRQALARLLAWAQMADKPAAWVYPEFFEGITKAGCWTAYAGDGSAAADGVKRIPLYRGALTGGDERRHIICLCPDCTKPAQQQRPVGVVAPDPGRVDWLRNEPEVGALLYTSPPASKPLTDEEIEAAMPSGIYDCLADPWDCGVGDGNEMRSVKKDVLRIARAIEAAHGIKGDA